MKLFKDVYDYCQNTLRSNPIGLTNPVDGGYVQIYANPVNVQIAITPAKSEYPTLKLEYHDDIHEFSIGVIEKDNEYIINKRNSYSLDQEITCIINDMYGAYLLVDAVSILLKI